MCCNWLKVPRDKCLAVICSLSQSAAKDVVGINKAQMYERLHNPFV
jgi:hypothetical protein